MTGFVISSGLLLLSIAMVAGLFLLVIMHQKRNRKKKRLLRRLSYLGSDNNLVFTSQQAWNNRAMGFDAVQRKILFLHCNGDGKWKTDLIQLDDVKACRVQVSDENTGSMHEKKLLLQFQLFKNNQVKNIPFYEAADDAGLFFKLHKKAKDWQGVLSKMLPVEQA